MRSCGLEFTFPWIPRVATITRKSRPRPEEMRSRAGFVFFFFFFFAPLFLAGGQTAAIRRDSQMVLQI